MSAIFSALNWLLYLPDTMELMMKRWPELIGMIDMQTTRTVVLVFATVSTGTVVLYGTGVGIKSLARIIPARFRTLKRMRSPKPREKAPSGPSSQHSCPLLNQRQDHRSTRCPQTERGLGFPSAQPAKHYGDLLLFNATGHQIGTDRDQAGQCWKKN